MTEQTKLLILTVLVSIPSIVFIVALWFLFDDEPITEKLPTEHTEYSI